MKSGEILGFIHSILGIIFLLSLTSLTINLMKDSDIDIIIRNLIDAIVWFWWIKIVEDIKGSDKEDLK